MGGKAKDLQGSSHHPPIIGDTSFLHKCLQVLLLSPNSKCSINQDHFGGVHIRLTIFVKGWWVLSITIRTCHINWIQRSWDPDLSIVQAELPKPYKQWGARETELLTAKDSVSRKVVQQNTHREMPREARSKNSTFPGRKKYANASHNARRLLPSSKPV